MENPCSKKLRTNYVNIFKKYVKKAPKIIQNQEMASKAAPWGAKVVQKASKATQGEPKERPRRPKEGQRSAKGVQKAIGPEGPWAQSAGKR